MKLISNNNNNIINIRFIDIKNNNLVYYLSYLINENNINNIKIKKNNDNTFKIIFNNINFNSIKYNDLIVNIILPKCICNIDSTFTIDNTIINIDILDILATADDNSYLYINKIKGERK